MTPKIVITSHQLRFSVILLITFTAKLFSFVDLETKIQDFVLETRQVTIPEYPDAFNPSIIRWKGTLLLCFRARNPLNGLTNFVGFVELNANFDPTGKVYPLNFHHEELMGTLVQDPRLIVVDESLHVVYSNTWNLPHETVRRVYISEVKFDGERYIAHNPEVFLRFDGIESNKYEKNWVPFNHEGQLLLAYTINPHKIFLPLFGKKKCLTIASSEHIASWEWGELRGGTQAFVVDGNYLAFFHSVVVMETTHSNGKPMPHYFMGAYTFERQPPFSLIGMSPEFIVGKGFYGPPYYQTWKPLRVVFPGGFVFDDKTIVVSYGRQDHEMWLIKLDKKKLLESLTPVQRIE